MEEPPNESPGKRPTDMAGSSTSRGLMFFVASAAASLEEDGMMTPAVLSQDVLDAIDFAPFATGSRVKVLFKSDGMSLIHAWFGPGYRLPRHSHSADCLYYVVAGAAIMGARTIAAATVSSCVLSNRMRTPPGLRAWRCSSSGARCRST